MEWSGVDTPKTVMTTRAPAVLKMRPKRESSRYHSGTSGLLKKRKICKHCGVQVSSMKYQLETDKVSFPIFPSTSGDRLQPRTTSEDETFST